MGIIKHFTAGLTTKRALCVMTLNWPPLTNHDSSKALRGVKGALSSAILRLTPQREVREVLKDEVKITFQLAVMSGEPKHVYLCSMMLN